MIKGVIFDLDGTLIDSMKVWSKADRRFLKECGVENPPEEISEKVRKMSVDEAALFFISEFKLECTKEYVINRIEELVRFQYESVIQLKPDVPEILDYLDSVHIPYGIATATYKSLAKAVLRRCGIIDRFAFILTDKEFPAGKTAPDIFLGGAAALCAEPKDVLVAEDSLHCVETAKAAGFFTVGVYDEVSAGERDIIEKISDAYIMRLGELKKFL